MSTIKGPFRDFRKKYKNFPHSKCVSDENFEEES
jgi:hypothetical protein